MQKSFQNRRRRYIVNKPVQNRIIFTISFMPILGLVGATLAVAILAGRVLDEARSVDENIPTLGPLFIAMLLFILSSGGVVVLQAVRYSNRIAGPTYRLVKSLERVMEGDLNFRVKLREGDELTDLAEALNRHIDWLQEHPPMGIDLKIPGEKGLEPTEESESARAETEQMGV
ncbi:MAG: HAMP domain-containing protein [Planctomycetota bacterium]